MWGNARRSSDIGIVLDMSTYHKFQVRHREKFLLGQTALVFGKIRSSDIVGSMINYDAIIWNSDYLKDEWADPGYKLLVCQLIPVPNKTVGKDIIWSDEKLYLRQDGYDLIVDIVQIERDRLETVKIV
jgi:hypothetical protein